MRNEPRQTGGGGDLETYLTDISRTEIPSPAEVARLVSVVRDRTQSRDVRIDARNRLVVGNLRLVVSIVRPYRNMGLTLADLISEGNVGLMRAVRGYKPNVGTKFSSYAPFWIRAAVRQAISRQTRQVRFPDYMHWLLRKYDKTRTDLSCRLGRPPEVSEVRTAMGLSAAQAKHLEAALMTADACRPPAGGPEEAGSRSVGPDEAASRKDGTVWLAGLMRRLPKRYARILRRRLGDGKSLSQIGQEMGLTRERVRQIGSEAMAMIRAAANKTSMVAAARSVRAARKRKKQDRVRPPTPGLETRTIP